jgi:hypothetical protein
VGTKVKKDWTVIAVFIVMVFLLLILGCAIIALLIYPAQSDNQSTGTQNTAQAGNGSSAGQINYSALNISQENIELWHNITKQNVEQACLTKAKEEAGPSKAGLVFGCTCTESTVANRKTYNCNIATADPFTRYFVNIDCLIETQKCTLSSSQGTQTVTFTQIREWSGQ